MCGRLKRFGFCEIPGNHVGALGEKLLVTRHAGRVTCVARRELFKHRQPLRLAPQSAEALEVEGDLVETAVVVDEQAAVAICAEAKSVERFALFGFVLFVSSGSFDQVRWPMGEVTLAAVLARLSFSPVPADFSLVLAGINDAFVPQVRDVVHL